MRNFLSIVISASFVSLLLTGCQKREPAASKRPNVLLIVADDLGFTDIGAYGSEIDTPALDQLARNGLKFSDFRSGMACSPSRAMLLTGADAHLVGLGGMNENMAPNQRGRPGYEGHLNFAAETLPAALKSSGYRTYMTGKWHLGMEVQTSPSARGFDQSFALLEGGSGNYSDMQPQLGTGKAKYRYNKDMVESLPDDFYSSSYYVDKMIEFISNDSETTPDPFFGYLAFTAPHWPLQAPAETIDKYEAQYIKGYEALYEERLSRAKDLKLIPANTPSTKTYYNQTTWASLTPDEQNYEARRMATYAAMIDEMDKNIARMLDYLKSSGQFDNTVVIFMSDNGAEGHDFKTEMLRFAQHAASCCDNSYENIGKPNSYVEQGPNWARASNAGFRLFKAYPSEGGIRSPLIIHYPEMKAKGLSKAQIHVKDIMPSILELTNSAVEKNSKFTPITGRSFASILDGRSEEVHSANTIFADELMGKRMLRKGEWKAIHMRKPQGTGDWQLYNLRTDISESIDLAKENPEKLRELIEDWDNYAAANKIILPNKVTLY